MSRRPYPTTEEGWNELAEFVTLHRKDISPESIAALSVDATQTIYTWYSHEERSTALQKRAFARNRLLDLAEVEASEMVRQAIEAHEPMVPSAKQDWGWGRGQGYCWTVADHGTGEIVDSAQKYTSAERAKQGVVAEVEKRRAFSIGPFHVQIFDEPPSFDPYRERTMRKAVLEYAW